MYTDSHAHITSDQLYPEIETLLKQSQESDVSTVINICTDPTTLRRGIALSQQYPWVYNAAATTPHDVEHQGERDFSLMRKHALEGMLIAVGETGLDYYYSHSKPHIQKEFFRRYLHLALECQLPVIIHCRNAFNDFFEIIDTEYQGAPGVLHCFTGTLQEAKQVLSRGWYLSLSGIVTFKKSTELREIAKITPLDHLLIETDAPYLAPQSKRGKQNTPANLPEIAQLIANLKGIDVNILAQATTDNARKLFTRITN